MMAQFEKDNHLLSTAANRIADLTTASSLASTMMAQFEKDNHLLSTAANRIADLTTASSLASTMMAQFEKDNRLLSTTANRIADLTTASSSISAILEQFDKIGLSSVDIVAKFENRIQSKFPGINIDLNFKSTLPSIESEVTNQLPSTVIAESAQHELINIFQIYLYRVLCIFLKSMLAISVGILSAQINDRYITPMVNAYNVTKNLSSEKEKIFGIRKLAKGNKEINIESSRFITKDRVNLRSGPSTKTEILSELEFGQVVTIVSKKRDWVEINYIYENEILQGWVSTRFIRKFK